MNQSGGKSVGPVLLALCVLLAGAMLAGCAQTPIKGAPVDHARLRDGIYEGSSRGGPNKVSVQITIRDSSISEIEILEHQAWRGGIAEKTIVARIIANQSTSVDAVSGATNSSRVIMNAVQNAIEKAYSDE
jgi:uncharacterized protein with FMN-binding domain